MPFPFWVATTPRRVSSLIASRHGDPAHLVGARELELGGDDVSHLIDAVGDVVRNFQEDLHVSGLSFSLLHPVNLPFRHQWLIIMKSL